jgi:hypothetical protein
VTRIPTHIRSRDLPQDEMTTFRLCTLRGTIILVSHSIVEMPNDITMETLQQFMITHPQVHFHLMKLMMLDTRGKQPTLRTLLEAHHQLYPQILTALIDLRHQTFLPPQTEKIDGKLRRTL